MKFEAMPSPCKKIIKPALLVVKNKTAHPKATMLGAELDISVAMFRELQNTYLDPNHTL